MSDTLNPSLPERTLWPYAVGVQTPSEERPTYVHFDDKGTAALHAMLLEGGGNKVTRHVAVLDSHILHSTVLGWREVTYFLLADGSRV